MTAKLMMLLACLACLACLASPLALAVRPAPLRAGEPAPIVATVAKPDPGTIQLSQRIITLRRASEDLRTAARQPAPKGLTPEQQAQARDYDRWLQQSSARLDALAKQGDKLLQAGAPPEDTMAFNQQYQQLQGQMQHENQSYTAVSDIMKKKHGTATHSIENVR